MAIKIDKILCATDFSNYADYLLQYGAGLAKQLEARLIVFHTVYFQRNQMYVSPAMEQGETHQLRMAKAHEKISAFMQGYDIEWEPFVSCGDTIDEILKATTELDIQLTIAAIHRLSGFQRFFLGTLVEQLARKLRRPFLVINPKRDANSSRSAAGLHIKRVIVGCQSPRPSAALLRHAQYFASHFTADLHALHALQAPLEPGRETDEEPLGPYRKQQEALQNRLHKDLKHTLDQEIAISGKVNAIIKAGTPQESLLNYASRQTADLILIGVRQQGSLEKAVIGSTTEAVMRKSPCPVLVIPDETRADEIHIDQL